MSTTLDIKILPKVKAIILKYGKNAIFSLKNGVPQPATGDVSVVADTTYAGKVTPPAPYNRKLVDGDMIKQDDTQIIIAASGLAFTPTSKMTVTIDSIVWGITSVAKIYSGEDIAVYDLQLRR